MYKDTTFSSPVSVDFFMGGNMSFRRSILQRMQLDFILNEHVAFYWELDMAQQVKQLGFTLLFNPAIKVNHYSATRETNGLRTVNYDGVYYSNFNYAYLILKHLSLSRKFAYLLYTLLVGTHLSSGLLHVLAQLMKGNMIDWHNDILPSLRGRIAGILAYTMKSDL